MAFGNETAGWIHDPLAAISDVAFHHKLPGLALRAQAKAFVSDEFVGGEAVVQLNHLNVMRFDARHGISGSGCALGHTRANHLHHAAFKGGFGVGGHADTDDLNGFILEPVGNNEALRHDDRDAGAIRRGAALELGHGMVNFWAGHDLLKRVYVSELCVWVVCAVAVVFLGDTCKYFGACAVLLHVLATSIAEHLRRHGRGANLML